MSKKASNACVALIKEEEAFESSPYLCPAKVPTIGFGSTKYADGRKVSLADKPITEDEAVALLYATLVEYENIVNKYVKVELTQNQFDALVDFCYNVGEGNFSKSTLLKKLNAEDFTGAAAEFDKWVMARGKVLRGLVRRRSKEKALFLKK